MKTLSYIEVQQPIGTFYLCAIQAMDLLSIVDVNQRTSDNEAGIQRERSKSRIKQRGPFASPCLETNVVRLTEITAECTCQGKLAQYGF